MESLLYLDGVTVSFDGFKALNGLSLVLQPGEMRAVIGPNGAGKTTMMDVITGKTRPQSGTVLFEGATDLTRLRENDIAMLGIGRKFQRPTVFEQLSVWDNLELALKAPRGPFKTLVWKAAATDRTRINEILALTRLGDRRDRLAGGLSHGEKQWLEIGMLLLQEPEVLLLDEPVAGMTDRETEKTGELLRQIVRKRTVVVVEHDMEFVRRFASRVTVMHEGKLLKEGTMEEVQRDERVAEVYLGRRRDADAVGSTA